MRENGGDGRPARPTERDANELARRLPFPRKVLFALVPLAALLVLLLALEGTVRLLDAWRPSDFADTWLGTTDIYPFFHPVEGKEGLLRMRPQPSSTPVERETFAVPKPDGTFRIFVLGGSTVQGGLSYEIARALARTRPDRRTEVINAGLAGFDTRVHRNVLAEVLRYQPDLVVLYAGHNEWGTGRWLGTTRAPGPLTALRMALERRSRVAMAAGALLDRVARRLDSVGERLGITPSEGRQTFTSVPGGPISRVERRVVEARFRRNLLEMAAQSQAHGVPFVVCTVVSNLLYLPEPTGDRKAPAGYAGRALAALGVELGGPRAGELYRTGLALLADDLSGGLSLLRQARDLDSYPLRAWTALNEVVRTAAAESDALLVDVEALFEPAAYEAGDARRLFLDQVHPNLPAQRYIGEEIAARLPL